MLTRNHWQEIDALRLSDCEFRGGMTLTVRQPRPWHVDEALDRVAAILGTRHAYINDIVGMKQVRDIWIRDWSPLPVVRHGEPALLTAEYAPAYAKYPGAQIEISDAREAARRITDLYGSRVVDSGWRTEFGNLAHNGRDKAIMTTQFLVSNCRAPAARPRLARRMRYWFRRVFAADLLIIPFDHADPIRHADGYCRFLSEDVLVIGEYEGGKLKQMHDQIATLVREMWPRLEIVRLPCAEPAQFVAQDSPWAAFCSVGNYVNFYRNGEMVLVPEYGLDVDQRALSILKEACPKLVYETIPSRRLALLGGILNCVTATYDVV